MIVVAYLYIATYSVILVVNLITLKQGSEHLLNVVPRRSYYIKEEENHKNETNKMTSRLHSLQITGKFVE